MKNNVTLKSMGFGLLKVVAFVIIVQIITSIFLIPIRAISQVYWSHLDGRGLNEPWFIFSTIILLLSSIVACFIFLKYLDKKKWDYIRITYNNFSKYFLLGIIISIALIIVFTIINAIAGNIAISLNINSITNILLYLFFGIIALFCAVVYEEIICRGYILRTFEEHYNKTTAIILSSLLFGIAHFSNPNSSILGSFNIILAGVILSLICIHFNNLWLPIGIHFGWNFSLWFFNFPVSGQVYPNPILSLHNNTYNRLVGSKFGPEDSILVTIILSFAIGYFLLKYKSKGKVEHAIEM